MSWTSGESIELPNGIKAQQFEYPSKWYESSCM